MSLYYLGNARNHDQLTEMRRLEAEGVCLFCPPNLGNSRRLLHRTELWSVTPNEFPYRGTRMHVMLVPDEHVIDMADLSPAAQQDFWRALTWVRDHYRLEHFGLAARNGRSEYTGGTIRHLHVHVLQGDPEQEPVRVKLSSSGVDPDQLDAGRP